MHLTFDLKKFNLRYSKSKIKTLIQVDECIFNNIWKFKPSNDESR